MKTILSAALFGGLLALGAATGASAVTLTGTIRDFSITHPDMQNVIGGVQTGQVEATLGADGLPVWKGPAKPGFTTKENFDQWYRDVAGVNLSRDFDLTLAETAPGSGILAFSDSTFFPIDGQMGGNEGAAHNYFFTLQLAGRFSFKAGQSFTFTGDDDLWVFFGGKLGIDLGGVHPAASRTVTSADLVALGLAPGTNYALDIFFAERHKTQSNFRIETSFAVEPPSVIPVPATLPLLLAGIGAVGVLSRRRRAA